MKKITRKQIRQSVGRFVEVCWDDADNDVGILIECTLDYGCGPRVYIPRTKKDWILDWGQIVDIGPSVDWLYLQHKSKSSKKRK